VKINIIKENIGIKGDRNKNKMPNIGRFLAE
jgi:hypothetical protein